MTAWIGETVRNDAGWDHLETLVDIPVTDLGGR